MKKRYYDFNTYLRSVFGERVQKISVDAGLTCPNRDGTLSVGGCIYCNPKGSGTGAGEKGQTLTEQIRISSRFIARRYKARKFLIYLQSFTNTYAPPEHLKQLYDEALTAIDGIVGLSIGTRPDCVDDRILELIQSYADRYLMWIEYGLQSVHDQTLIKINRGHNFRAFQKAVNLTRNRGIRICAHVILGLPGEDRRMMLETARTVAQSGIDGIKLHLLYVVKGTLLEAMYRRGEYQCLEPEAYADLVREFLEYLPPDIVIQRVTSDPHPDELVAPAWCGDKMLIRNMLKDIMERKDSWQGKRYRPI